MPLSRSNTARSRSRSPVPPPASTSLSYSPRPFLPPSHYAAAGGLHLPDKGNSSKYENEYEPNSSPQDAFIPVPYLAQASTSDSSLGNELPTDSRPTSSGKGKSAPERTRKRRESQLTNLPLVEAQLLPSLRDTIDRMTRPPSRIASKAAPSTPTIKLSQDFDYDIPSPRSPAQPHTRSIHLNSISTLSPEPFGGPSTPKVAHSTPKSALKSALKSPTPKSSSSKPEIPDTTNTGGALKSVRSLLRRKSSASSIVADSVVSGKKASKENESADLFNVIRLNGTRSRSRTDPGVFVAPKEPLQNMTLATPQLPSQTLSSKAYTSHIPRFRGKFTGNTTFHRPELTDESDLEYRYELQGREKRKLTVTNAEIIPSDSSSESEVESVRFESERRFAGNRFKDQAVVGLGFQYGEDFQVHDDFERDTHIHRVYDDVAKNKHFSMVSYPSAGSIYTDEESEQEMSKDSDISGESGSLLDETSSRRRAALLGLVQDLDLQTAASKKVLSGAEESDYSGEDGLAVSGSGATGFEGQQSSTARDGTHSESEPEYESEEQKATVVAPTLADRISRLSRAPTPKVTVQDEDGKTSHYHTNTSSKSSGKSPSSFASKIPSPTSKIPSPSRLALRSNSRSPRSSYAEVAEPIHSITKRRSFLQERHLSPASTPRAVSPSSSHHSPVPANPGKRDSCNYESVLIAKRSMEAVVRNRQAFGIPPSESEELYRTGETLSREGALAHTDSMASGVDVESWQHDGENELSAGAETLFRTLSGGEQAYEGRRSYSRSEKTVHSTFDDGEDRTRERRQSRHRSRTPIQRRISEQTHHDEDKGHVPPNARSWRACMDAAAYQFYFDRHGEVEMQRQEIIWKLRESEKDFVQRLTSVVHLFMLPLRIQDSKTWIAGVPLEIAKTLDWLEDIIKMHEDIQETLLSVQPIDNPFAERVADLLRVFTPRFEIYQPYLVKVPGVVEMLERLVRDGSSEFGEFVRLQEKTRGSQGSLADLLAEPSRRLSLYPEVFRKLLDATPKSHQDYLSTLILVRSTSLVIKTLKEVKAREEDYDFIKDISERIDGFSAPASTHLPRRDRRLLCRGQLLQVREPKTSNPQDQGATSIKLNRTSRLVTAISEWDARRPRSDSVKSTASTDTALSYQSVEATPPPPSLPIEMLVFSDLILLVTARRENQEQGTERWKLCEDTGVARVVDVSEAENKNDSGSPLLALDVLSAGSDFDQGAVLGSGSWNLKTIFFALPYTSKASPSPTRHAWLSSLRRTCQATLRALSDPRLPRDSLVDGPNRLLEHDRKRILESILASGLPLPKSPSLQLGDFHAGKVKDSTKAEREERGWWTLRFQQVLQELLQEDLLEAGHEL